jgi:predicted alpha-1,6-mannanase (GH76 family)
MACINFPTVVAALTLADGVPKKQRAAYLAKGKEIYAWAVEHLFDPATGRVADNCHGSAEPDWTVHVYNQGTFIGASVLLYKATGEKTYLENAIRAADYTVEKMSAVHGVLPYEWGIEQGIYTAIFAQYMAMLVYDAGQRQYIPFLRHSAVAERDNPTMQRDSYSASGAPALMLLFPTE